MNEERLNNLGLLSGVQLHDACESMGLTRRHLYSLITATREVPGGAAFGVRISGPPLLGKTFKTPWLHESVHIKTKAMTFVGLVSLKSTKENVVLVNAE